MKQILHNLENWDAIIEEVPYPCVNSGHLLIRTTTSLVSAGTEKMMVDFAKANLIDKTRQQPDNVTMVIDKVNTDGSMPTIEAVRSKIAQSLPPDHCNVGEVIEVGCGVEGFQVGDWGVSNEKHAEVACAAEFVNAVKEGRSSLVSFDELMEVSRISIEIAESLEK